MQGEQTTSAQIIIINPTMHLTEFCKETKMGTELTVHDTMIVFTKHKPKFQGSK